VDGGESDMSNLTPASNIQAATIAGFIAVLIEHVCSANGIIIPPDVSSTLPGVLVILTAHIWDVTTGDNKKTDQK